MKEVPTLPATATGAGTRSLTGTFDPIEIAVPRARLNTTDGKTTDGRAGRCGLTRRSPCPHFHICAVPMK